jgi:hypothetical protein
MKRCRVSEYQDLIFLPETFGSAFVLVFSLVPHGRRDSLKVKGFEV